MRVFIFSIVFSSIALLGSLSTANAEDRISNEQLRAYLQSSPDFKSKVQSIRAMNKELEMLNRQLIMLNMNISRIEKTGDPELRDALLNHFASTPGAGGATVKQAIELETVVDSADQLLSDGDTNKAIKDLGAAPTSDDLTAILVFSALQKMSEGENINLDTINDLYESNIPDEWKPALEMIRDKFPAPQTNKLPPMQGVPNFTVK